MILEFELPRFAKEFEALLPLAQGLGADLERKISRILEEEGVNLAVPIITRVKSWQSTRQKLLHSPLQPKCLHDLQDLIGVRVVLLFERDAARVRDLLSGLLTTLKRYNPSSRLLADQFGYASTHIVVSLPLTDRELPTGASLSAEIQVRTVAQHLWAAASHVLQYKKESAVPPRIRRAVHRAAALLETVDLEFERVLAEREEYSAAQPELDSTEELNVDSLRGILNALWPASHRLADEPHAMLLESVEGKGITTPRRLYEAIRPHRAAVLAYAAEEAQRLVFLADRHGVRDGNIRYNDGPTKSHSIRVTDDILARAREGVCFSHTGLTWGALGLAEGTALPKP